MSGTWTTYLLRFGEIGIKSRSVRRRFVDQLLENLEAHFHRAGATCLIDRQWGRIYLDTPDEATARHAIASTFGLVSGSPTVLVDATMEAITGYIEKIAPDHVAPDQSFAIRARRTGQHPFTSQEVGAQGGAAVLRAVPEARVDLTTPDVEISVEVRDDKAYIFTETIQGPGGLPMGSQGSVVVPVLGPRSPAAAWLAMRRGAQVHLLVPEEAMALVEPLRGWAPNTPMTVVEGSWSREGLLALAAQVARERDANAIVLDDHETRAGGSLLEGIPVLRPLAGLPGRRWPEGAYRASKAAADAHPGPCVRASGRTAEAVAGALEESRRDRL
ncbi:MAG: THUMP domain-containing protein [Candidatus Thermoplasmatota archaeon]|nr:THUMP domain-containing protein [Candidatus Thermoplasmatota archaeon]